jgi:tRNA C32,U32 (ribose-2'-O)-methylase TrmJ
MAMPDEIDTPKIVVAFAIGTVAVLLIVVAAQVFYYELSHELDQEANVQHVNQGLARYYAEQDEKLHHLGWVDQKADQVGIPIERAMQLTLRDLRNLHGHTTTNPAASPRSLANGGEMAKKRSKVHIH